jgi:fructose-1,6-bisphosphatase/sedoheptulose 1,7-bisphosphatase-like protein
VIEYKGEVMHFRVDVKAGHHRESYLVEAGDVQEALNRALSERNVDMVSTIFPEPESVTVTSLHFDAVYLR